MAKFNVGDKVVPINKTVKSYENLRDSKNWNKAQKVNQPFLYIQYFDDVVNAYVCNLDEKARCGCYFNESDLIPYKKVTKNQRITALENEVAELRPLKQEVADLKLIVHELRGRQDIDFSPLTEPSTINTVEDIIEFEGQQYRKVERKAQFGDVVIFRINDTDSYHSTTNKPYEVTAKYNGHPRFVGDSGSEYSVYTLDHNRTLETVDVYELIESKPLTPNQQRAEIIEKARQFIDATASDDTHFEIQGNQVLAWRIIRKGTGYDALTGVAVCSPNDVFNEDIGRAIAVGRMEGLDVSEFEQAVQPNRRTDGMVMEYRDRKLVISNHYVFGETCDFDSEFARHGTIINDTNAKYEVK